jgi:hypothetical protein
MRLRIRACSRPRSLAARLRQAPAAREAVTQACVRRARDRDTRCAADASAPAKPRDTPALPVRSSQPCRRPCRDGTPACPRAMQPFLLRQATRPATMPGLHGDGDIRTGRRPTPGSRVGSRRRCQRTHSQWQKSQSENESEKQRKCLPRTTWEPITHRHPATPGSNQRRPAKNRDWPPAIAIKFEKRL